ncbi:MAG: polysaccharide biosynthesis tyrosine autokinase [Candidatus Aminicenantes bacterium]|nr:polysaccharide biosynthesis tyrosine autokinase [Candidatus Aminicenantes bacterium]
MNTKTEKKEIDLVDFIQIAQKRKGIIIASVLIILVLGGVYSFTRTPLYRAQTKILLDTPASTNLTIDELFTSSYGNESYLMTQLKLLKSRTVAERVARKLKLADRLEVRTLSQKKETLIQTIKDFVLKWVIPRGKDPVGEIKERIEEDPHSKYAWIVQRGLGIQQEDDTKIVNINFTSSQPELAADIAKTIVQEFIDFTVELRYDSTQQASEFLNEQISVLKTELEAKEQELQRYGKDKKILFLSDAEQSVVGMFESLNNAYMNAILERIKKEAFYREIRGSDVDSIPLSVTNSLLTSLRTEYINLKNAYQTKSKYLKLDHPEMQNLQGSLTTVRDSLATELEKAQEASFNEYQAALESERDFERELEQQKREVFEMNNNAVYYNSLNAEIQNIRNLLQGLATRQNETLVSARLGGLSTSNIKIIDPALIPSKPFSPNKKRNIIMSLILGLFIGTGLAFFVDYMDNTVKGPEEVEKLVGLPSLGVIPSLSGNNSNNNHNYSYYSQQYVEENPESSNGHDEIKEIEMINHFYPNLHICEDYRTVRTSILFSHAGNSPETIVFTSAFPQEGKTSTITNIAISFGQLEKKVLLIDADLRKPRLHKVFEARNRIGLSSCLTGISSVENAIQETAVENLWLLPSGLHPPNPAELINSQKMKEVLEDVKKNFDAVFIDSPPVLAVIDPIIIASLVDAVVFVLKEGKTSRKPLVKAINELNKVQANIIGVVFNDVKMKKSGYNSPYYKDYMHSYVPYEKAIKYEYEDDDEY